ncbi:MAG: hypothetical protein LBP42_06610 [Treponema sp.]|jgi:hypothetical protein|nr:hypothetical protein [Treponema sp.]
MKKRVLFFISLWLLPVVVPAVLHGQSSSSTSGAELKSTQFDTAGLPQWGKDLRRAEIVAFGSFPFTFFFSTFAIDAYRSASHNWDMRYAPWPLKSAGAVSMTKDELLLTMSIAAAGSVVISLTDFFLVKYKRHKQERALENSAGETPIILRSPRTAGEEPGETGGLPGEEETPSQETPSEISSEPPVSEGASDRTISEPGAAPGRP